MTEPGGDADPGTGRTDETGPVARDGAPGARRLAATLVAVEAVVLIVLGVLSLVETVVSTPTEVAGAVALGVITIMIGAGLGLVARGLAIGLRWSRAPALTWQLLQGSLAFPLARSELWYLGVPLAASAVVVAVLMLGRWVFPPLDAAREV